VHETAPANPGERPAEPLPTDEELLAYYDLPDHTTRRSGRDTADPDHE
jgi:hypothetical protein